MTSATTPICMYFNPVSKFDKSYYVNETNLFNRTLLNLEKDIYTCEKSVNVGLNYNGVQIIAECKGKGSGDTMDTACSVASMAIDECVNTLAASLTCE